MKAVPIDPRNATAPVTHVKPRLPGALSERTRDKGKRQICFGRFAAIGLGDDVIEMKSSFLPHLGEQTVFASVVCPASHLTTQPGWNRIHRLSPILSSGPFRAQPQQRQHLGEVDQSFRLPSLGWR